MEEKNVDTIVGMKEIGLLSPSTALSPMAISSPLYTKPPEAGSGKDYWPN